LRSPNRHGLPAVYSFRHHVEHGGLISYAPDALDVYLRAAGYVDRILKGEKPADLPVQAPVKFELVINLKTAKTLSFDVPPSLLARITPLKVRRRTSSEMSSGRTRIRKIAASARRSCTRPEPVASECRAPCEGALRTVRQSRQGRA
jgi:ABC transporter substrate binding protein